MNKGQKKRIMDKKWEKLKASGLKPPKSERENEVRAKAAHGY